MQCSQSDNRELKAVAILAPYLMAAGIKMKI